MPIGEVIDFAPGAKCETFIIGTQRFLSTFTNQTTKALFDHQIREKWGGHPAWIVYGEASVWNIQYATWNLEKKAEASEINFKSIPGANHFVRLFSCLVIHYETLF